MTRREAVRALTRGLIDSRGFAHAARFADAIPVKFGWGEHERWLMLREIARESDRCGARMVMTRRQWEEERAGGLTCLYGGEHYRLWHSHGDIIWYPTEVLDD